MNTMEAKEAMLGMDENCILLYLRTFRGAFITEMEITRHADGRKRFMENKHWARSALIQLLELGLVETDGLGRYQIHSTGSRAAYMKRKFLAPQLRDILEHCEHQFDLSSFA